MMPYLTQMSLAFFGFFVSVRVVAGNYLEILHRGVGEATFESKLGNVAAYSPKDNLWSISELATERGG